MIEVSNFIEIRLPGGFVIEELRITDEPMVDAIGREALAQTRISGCRFSIRLRGGAGIRDESISLYHEVLEAAAVASDHPPSVLVDFNEADFERAAVAACDKFGPVTPEGLFRMLRQYGFGAET
jgi:hypothetical protein